MELCLDDNTFSEYYHRQIEKSKSYEVQSSDRKIYSRYLV